MKHGLKTCLSFILILIALSFHFSAYGAEDSPPVNNVSVKGVRYTVEAGRTKIFIDLSGPAEFKQMMLAKPDRLCLDISGAAISGSTKSVDVKDGVIKSIRAGQFSPDTARVVIEFEDAGKSGKFDIKREASGLSVTMAAAMPTAMAVPPPAPTRVVIDAGHGGHDPGAVGLKGLKEKDVTLAIALKVKRMLEKNKKYEVYLTRSRDVFIGLEKRAQIANKKGADIFVSIHANANPNRAARGIESYILNWTDDEEAMKVAARENAITLRRMREARSDVGMILASLELQSKRDESLGLAHLVQSSVIDGLGGKYKEAVNLGVKQAMFYVLVGAKMPSVLVEVSFISNPKEEKLLRNNDYREYLARGVVDGVIKYLESAKPASEAADKPAASDVRPGRSELALRFE